MRVLGPANGPHGGRAALITAKPPTTIEGDRAR
jgi:hypothetical protein